LTLKVRKTYSTQNNLIKHVLRMTGSTTAPTVGKGSHGTNGNANNCPAVNIMSCEPTCLKLDSHGCVLCICQGQHEAYFLFIFFISYWVQHVDIAIPYIMFTTRRSTIVSERYMYIVGTFEFIDFNAQFVSEQ
jgi:hypothetical protein